MKKRGVKETKVKKSILAGGGLVKTANYGGSGSSVSSVSSTFYTPELTPESWLLPKSRQEVIKWCRIFFNLEAYVQSIIMMHARYPFSKFDISCPDKSVQQFYEDMIENDKWSLYDTILKGSLSYWLYGEAIFFGNWDEKKKRWSRFALLEPEVVEIHQDLYDEDARYELIPTEELKKLVNSPDADSAARKEKLPEIVLKAVNSGKNIPLDPQATSIIARTTSPSAIRGTPVMQSIFKALIYQDFIRLAQLRIAERHQMPIELWTLGNLENKILPTEQDLADLKTMISQAVQAPPFVMVYPPIVDYKVLGVKDKLLNLYDDYNYIHDQILVGLGVNKNLILGEGPAFSNVKTMALHKLVMEYQAIRDTFEKWIINKVFRRVAEENGFYHTKNGKRVLMLPEISWKKSLDIEGEESQRKLYFDMWKVGIVSTETLMNKFPDLDFENEKKKLEGEEGTVFDKGTDRLPKKEAPKPATPAGTPAGTPGAKPFSERKAPKAPSAPSAPSALKVEPPKAPAAPEKPAAEPK